MIAVGACLSPAASAAISAPAVVPAAAGPAAISAPALVPAAAGPAAVAAPALVPAAAGPAAVAADSRAVIASVQIRRVIAVERMIYSALWIRNRVRTVFGGGENKAKTSAVSPDPLEKIIIVTLLVSAKRRAQSLCLPVPTGTKGFSLCHPLS